MTFIVEGLLISSVDLDILLNVFASVLSFIKHYRSHRALRTVVITTVITDTDQTE